MFRGHSTGELASLVTMSRVTYFILQAYTGTTIEEKQTNSEEVLGKMQVNGKEGRNKQGKNSWQ